VVSYGEKTEMCASYQNATYIYWKQIRFYYRALIDHKDKLIVSGVSGRPCPTGEITLHTLLLSSTGGSVWGQAEIATGYPLRSIQNTLAATNNAPPRNGNRQVFTPFASIIAIKHGPVNSVCSWPYGS
jgi:hypothetical protein